MSDDKSKNMDGQDARKRRIDQVFALLWLVVGIVIITQSWNLKYMAEYGPGPAFLPLWLAGGFIVMGFVIFAQVTFSRKKGESLSLPDKHSARQMILVMAGFFGFVFLAEWVGFILCIGLLFFFLLTVVERRRWKFALAVSVFSALVFWIIFAVGLKLHLPPGFLELL